MKLPNKHAHGPLTTKHVRWKETKDRIRRWAKRVMRRLEDKVMEKLMED